jgi:hypothetical protein
VHHRSRPGRKPREHSPTSLHVQVKAGRHEYRLGPAARPLEREIFPPLPSGSGLLPHDLIRPLLAHRSAARPQPTCWRWGPLPAQGGRLVRVHWSYARRSHRFRFVETPAGELRSCRPRGWRESRSRFLSMFGGGTRLQIEADLHRGTGVD